MGKSESEPAPSGSSNPERPVNRFSMQTYGLLFLAFLLTCAVYLWRPSEPSDGSWLSTRLSPSTSLQDGRLAYGSKPGREKVALEAHIMSKCPDARDCLQQLVVPAMEQISDIVDFKASFIGKVDQQDHTTVHCMHGPGECLGNQLVLCAESLYPKNSKIWLGFTMCLIQDYKEIPSRELVQSCALEHAVDFDTLNRCLSDEGNGEELLRNSVLRSQDKGVQYSCTVRIAEKIWCIRDNGQWKDCPNGSRVEDLIDEVKKQYNS